MCIAVYKPVGKKMPSKQTFKNCFSNNSDGAGFMFAIDGKVHIEKGFMTFNDFSKGLKNTLKKYRIKDKGTSIPMVFHFRITSQAGVSQELTHPYPICDNYDQMKVLSQDCDVGLAHNGIIDFASSYTVKDHNDTMEFIKNIVFNVVNTDKKFYNNSKTNDMLEYLLSGNRVVVLNGNGDVKLYGSWLENKGVFYSNSTYSYSHKDYFKSKTSTSSSLDNWKKFYGYDDYDYEYEVEEKAYDKNKKYFWASEKMIKALKKGDAVICEECGQELNLEYNYISQEYELTCGNCNEVYLLDDIMQDYLLDNNDIIENYMWSYGFGGAY